MPSIFWATHSPTLIPQQAHSPWDRIRDLSPTLSEARGYFFVCVCMWVHACVLVSVCFAGVCDPQEMDNEQELQGGRSGRDRKTQKGGDRKREVEVQRYKSPELSVSDEGQKLLLQLSGAQSEGTRWEGRKGGDMMSQRSREMGKL